MRVIEHDEITIRNIATIKDAMKQLDQASSKVLFVIDEEGALIGSISDGDIRRHILQNKSLDDLLENACNTKCMKFSQTVDRDSAIEQMETADISVAPVLDGNHRIISFITLPSYHKTIVSEHNKLNLPVVIMAGGKGTRMAPFTNVLPKPLIPIGEKTILELIIDEFLIYGIKDFHFTLNYRGEMIRAYFDGIQRTYDVSYAWEKDFNGTAASLKLVDGLSGDFIVSNCDIIVKADYSDVYSFHKKNNASLTVVSAIQHQQFPYGVIEFKEGGDVIGLKEKPEFTFPINTGVYILSPDCLGYIPENCFFHMTHLIEKLIAEGKKVMTYPVNESDFIDTGQWEEYQSALDRLL